MLRFLIATILLIAFSSFVSAQETVSPCPVIEVKGESGVTSPGDMMTFTSVISGDLQKYSVQYKWSIDKGTIIEGQGESKIIVDTTGLEDTTISATLEIIGLPENCNNSASETNIVAALFGCGLPLISPIGAIPDDQIRVELDNIFIFLQSNQTFTGYLITYGNEKEISKREKLIEKHIELRRYDRHKIVLMKGVNKDEISTVVYIVPEGVEPPTP